MTYSPMPLAALALAVVSMGLGIVASPQVARAQTQSETAQSETAAAEEDPVVARVNGAEIRRSAVFGLAGTLPPQYQQQIIQIYPMLVQRLVDFELANLAGRAQGLADDPEVKDRMAELESRVIREVWIERAAEARMTDESLRTRYDDYLAANPPADEQRARHILLKTEAEAREVIEDLNDGADFAELAKEVSTGPSGERGGDLGYFTAEQMVPEFSTAASALAPGEYSADPVQTQFGWHVIKLEDRRQVAPPSFADMEAQLRQESTRENVEFVLKELRDNATVEITPAGVSLDLGAPPAQ